MRIALLIALLLSVQTVIASPAYVTDGKVWYQVTDQGATLKAVPTKLIPFGIRHPKIKRFGHGIRSGCKFLQPIVNFAGSCAQIKQGLSNRGN